MGLNIPLLRGVAAAGGRGGPYTQGRRRRTGWALHAKPPQADVRVLSQKPPAGGRGKLILQAMLHKHGAFFFLPNDFISAFQTTVLLAKFHQLELSWVIFGIRKNRLIIEGAHRSFYYSFYYISNTKSKMFPMENSAKIFIGNVEIKQFPIFILPANPNLKTRAKALRQARNLSEVLFWMQVTKGGFHKIDFDRQKVIGNYIVDFYVKRLRLIIEIDGSSHIGKELYDAERERFLVSLGLTMYRISVFDIMQYMHVVIDRLEDFIVENYGMK